MSTVFRAQLVLMVLGHYAYGDHVTDRQAFGLRLRKIFRYLWRARVASEAAPHA